MKSTTYFLEITNQKAEKYLSERGKLACLPARAMLAKKFFCVSLLKTVLPFLNNQAMQFISCAIGQS